LGVFHQLLFPLYIDRGRSFRPTFAEKFAPTTGQAQFSRAMTVNV
jgi:hypothetical protein